MCRKRLVEIYTHADKEEDYRRPRMPAEIRAKYHSKSIFEVSKESGKAVTSDGIHDSLRVSKGMESIGYAMNVINISHQVFLSNTVSLCSEIASLQ
jgi:hypothetical protein